MDHNQLSKDYEMLPASSENVIYWAMIHIMIHRLKPDVI